MESKVRASGSDEGKPTLGCRQCGHRESLTAQLTGQEKCRVCGNGLERFISDGSTTLRPLIESEVDRDDDGRSTAPADLDEPITQSELIAARRRLQIHHQAVLEMQFIHKMGQAQVAEEIGVPLRAVKVVSLNALRALSREIGDARERGPVAGVPSAENGAAG